MNQLTSVTLPRSVTSIGDTAFDVNSINLTIRGFPDSYAEIYANNRGFNFDPFFNIQPRTVTIDKTEGPLADIVVTMTLNEYQFTKITYNGTDLVEGNQYTKVGNQITIKKQYLETLPLGTQTFKFVLNNGQGGENLVTDKE